MCMLFIYARNIVGRIFRILIVLVVFMEGKWVFERKGRREIFYDLFFYVFKILNYVSVLFINILK